MPSFSRCLFIYFIYLYAIFSEGNTHLTNIKLFYHVALSNKRNIYIKLMYIPVNISPSCRGVFGVLMI